MSHSIFEKMVYSFQKPMWHGITEPDNQQRSAIDVLDNRFGGGAKIALRPATITLNGVEQECGYYAIVREGTPVTPTEDVFGFCTKRYAPLQPRDIALSFDVNVNEPVETMAFLRNGKEMFISWQLPTFEVVKGDPLELFGIVRSGFDTLQGTNLFTSIYRPVCANTIAMAEGWAKAHTDGQGKGMIWKGKGINTHLLRDLGYWMAHVQETNKREVELLKGFFSKLVNTPIQNDQQVNFILNKAYPDKEDVSAYFPKQLREEKQERIEAYNETQENIRSGISALFGGVGVAITPDYYGLFNATTEYFCHYQPSKKPIAESAMFGSRHQNMMQMVEVLAETAK